MVYAWSVLLAAASLVAIVVTSRASDWMPIGLVLLLAAAAVVSDLLSVEFRGGTIVHVWRVPHVRRRDGAARSSTGRGHRGSRRLCSTWRATPRGGAPGSWMCRSSWPSRSSAACSCAGRNRPQHDEREPRAVVTRHLRGHEPHELRARLRDPPDVLRARHAVRGPGMASPGSALSAADGADGGRDHAHVPLGRPPRPRRAWSSCSSSSRCSPARWLMSNERAEQLEARTTQLASLQVGVLATLVQTLSLRDKMTARHSAAVARYAQGIAERVRLQRGRAGARPHRRPAARHRQVHLPRLDPVRQHAGSPTRIGRSSRSTRRRARRVVRSVDGYGPVADIILAHHERIDGLGYPHGLARRGHPAAVADHLGRRHLRRHDRARLLPQAGSPAGGDRGAAPRLGLAARRRPRRGLHQGPRQRRA